MSQRNLSQAIMPQFVFAAFLSVVYLSVGGTAMTWEEFGMQMSVNAYDAVCWYETLKQFPNTNTKGYNQCSGKAQFQKDQIMTNSFFEKYPDQRVTYFGKWTESNVIGKLPQEYKDNCGKYLNDPKAPIEKDESDALNDGENGDYPFRAYSYCLLSTLRKRHGDGAIEDVKGERTHSKKHWMATLLDRENEFRARHGAEPFTLSAELNKAAQEWAETNAKECKMYHSKNADPGRQFNGAGTGESLAAGGGKDEGEIAAYQAADGWYEEIKDYPYPDGYKGNGQDSLFPKIGHFTQSVWKGSKYVGYGYAYNPNCKPYQKYVAARYFPAGNYQGQYQANVLPPKD